MPPDYSDLEVLGAARREALAEVARRTKLLRAAVQRAMATSHANESAIARRADVDRMTVRRWVGKS